jgi:hypothetical protein
MVKGTIVQGYTNIANQMDVPARERHPPLRQRINSNLDGYYEPTDVSSTSHTRDITTHYHDDKVGRSTCHNTHEHTRCPKPGDRSPNGSVKPYQLREEQRIACEKEIARNRRLTSKTQRLKSRNKGNPQRSPQNASSAGLSILIFESFAMVVTIPLIAAV